MHQSTPSPEGVQKFALTDNQMDHIMKILRAYLK